ncbi:MAG TPA: type II toxin-antitoxin system PemK/MazF family toxin [Candidatus Binatia bacterium]|jgi:mRNA interferase MazF|nr:type II toxin-antitoxin system PemK/MazF family toxin [Candidatus Binatia bacterium]
MAFSRGDVVLIPFPYTDLSTAKTRPAVVVSSSVYPSIRSELLLAYVSSQISKVVPPLDYVLTDWKIAGLPKVSFVRPKLASIEPALVVHQVGKLSAQDSLEVDRRLRQALSLTETALVDVVAEVDLTIQPPAMVQTLAEKALAAIASFAAAHTAGTNIERLRQLCRKLA